MTRFRLTLNHNESKVVQAIRTAAGLFPLTIQGSVTIVCAATALSIYGYGSLDLIVFSLAICALAILVFCLFSTVLSGIVVQRKIRSLSNSQSSALADIKVEAGYPNETGFKLPSIRFLPLVKLDWKVAYPSEVVTRTRIDNDGFMLEEIIPQKRFSTNRIIRIFEITDVLGFCKYSWRQVQNVPAMALPQTNAMRSIPLLQSLTSEDGIPNPSGDPQGDLMEIRPYVPGDSVRHIMWKMFARNRQLNVRLAEKSVFTSKRTIAYLLASDNDEAAAAIARIAVETHAFGDDWAFGADGSETPCYNVPDALRSIAKSRSLGKPYSYGLDNFLKQESGQAGAHCIIFAAAENAPWHDSLRKTFGRYSGQFSIVMATDGFNTDKPISLWERMIKRQDQSEQPQSSTSMLDLRKILGELSQFVESATVVDRKSGQSFDKTLRRV